MDPFPKPNQNTRIGLHYYPDTLHFRESDLAAWLPEIQALGASWLTLVAPHDRAIPEGFLRGLFNAGIEPILHFHIPLDQPPHVQDLRLLFEQYARWGVHYVALFDRPNIRSVWLATSWAQNNLVERFLDIYLPLADAAYQAGLIPVFPPLEPGGDYWDTAFLRAALQGILRRGQTHLLDRLVLGAYAWTGNRSLNWGAGGPERWPAARPYYTPQGTEDQRGFRIFDWYLALAQAITRKPVRILILAGGSRLGDVVDPKAPPINEAGHAQRNIALAALMMNLNYDASALRSNSPVDTGVLEFVPSEVLACNFWLLSAGKNSPESKDAWFQPDERTLPVTGALRQWLASQRQKPTTAPTPLRNPVQRPPVVRPASPTPVNGRGSAEKERPIIHYLLLPTYEWGVADWHLDVIRPFVKKYHPTIGFSLEEASHAWRVTVIGGAPSFPEEKIASLRASGCIVEQISGDGTSIATQLATL